MPILAILRPNASQCTKRGTRWVHRLPSHISKIVPPTIHVGPLDWTNREPSFDGLNRHGKLRYLWAVDLGPFKLARIARQ